MAANELRLTEEQIADVAMVVFAALRAMTNGDYEGASLVLATVPATHVSYVVMHLALKTGQLLMGDRFGEFLTAADERQWWKPGGQPNEHLNGRTDQ